MRGVAQALDLLMPGRRGRIFVGYVVADDHPPSGPDNPSQLGGYAPGHRDVVEAETADRTVEARVGQIQGGRVANLEAHVAQTHRPGRPPPHVEHRLGQINAHHFVRAPGERPRDDPSSARHLEPTAPGLWGNQVDEGPEGLGGAHHRGSVKRLRLVGELVDDRVLVHRPMLWKRVLLAGLALTPLTVGPVASPRDRRSAPLCPGDASTARPARGFRH